MRPFTLCYGLMILALGSVAAYSITNADTLANPFGDPQVFASNAAADCQPTIILPPAKAADPATSTDACCSASESVDASVIAAPAASAIPTVVAGMSATEVRALLGEPEGISADGSRWSYGSSVLIFSNDRLAGHVAFDPVQAALNKYNNMLSSLKNSDPMESSTSNSTGPKILHAKVTGPRNSNRYLYSPIPAGSARSAYRYDRNNEEYSYYMNRVGPMDRRFSGKRFLPRGMMTTTDRNLAQSYLNYGSARYSNSPSTQYRR